MEKEEAEDPAQGQVYLPAVEEIRKDQAGGHSTSYLPEI